MICKRADVCGGRCCRHGKRHKKNDHCDGHFCPGDDIMSICVSDAMHKKRYGRKPQRRRSK